MSLELEVRPQATRDIRAIVLYIARQNRDFVVAHRVAEKLYASCGRLTFAPANGAPYKARGGVRKIVEGPYKIFYRVTDSKIIILRIWDGRRGHDPLL